MWPYPFDKDGKPADFISYHSVLAASLAGRRPETDAQLASAVNAMLAAQRPEGSWEGDPVYQGFNTPFRATQFAVMALSTLYPGPDRKPAKEKGWDDAFPAPAAQLGKNDLPLLLSQLDQFWDLAPEPVLRQMRAMLASSDQPLAREAAARALGHMADAGAVKTLVLLWATRTRWCRRTAGLGVAHDCRAPAGRGGGWARATGGRVALIGRAHTLGRGAVVQSTFQIFDGRSATAARSTPT